MIREPRLIEQVVAGIGESDRVAGLDRQRRARAARRRRARAHVLADEEAVLEDVHAREERDRDVDRQRVRLRDETSSRRCSSCRRSCPGASRRRPCRTRTGSLRRRRRRRRRRRIVDVGRGQGDVARAARGEHGASARHTSRALMLVILLLLRFDWLSVAPEGAVDAAASRGCRRWSATVGARCLRKMKLRCGFVTAASAGERAVGGQSGCASRARQARADSRNCARSG